MEAHPLRFFDDDGTEITPDLIPKPGLCLSCAKEDDPSEEPFCILTRFDQKDEFVVSPMFPEQVKPGFDSCKIPGWPD